MTSRGRVLIAGGWDADRRQPLAEYLRPEWDVTIAIGTNRSERRPGFEGYDLAPGMSLASDLSSIGELSRLIRRVQPTVVHLFDTKPSVLGRLALRRVSERLPCIVTVPGIGILASQGLAPRALSSLGVRPLLRLLRRDAAAFVFQTAHDRDYYVMHQLAPSDASHVIPGSGVDLTHFSRGLLTPEDLRNWRNAAGLQPTDIVLLCISRLQREKGVLEFARAVRLIAATVPRVKGVLLGQWTKDERSAVSAGEVQEIDRSVIWLQTQPDVRPALASSDLFVLPTRYGEGIPRSVLEAAAMEVPTVLGDSAGCVEFTDHGRYGRIVTEPTTANVAAAVQDVLAHMAHWTAVASAARLERMDAFCTTAVFASYDQLYKDVVGLYEFRKGSGGVGGRGIRDA